MLYVLWDVVDEMNNCIPNSPSKSKSFIDVLVQSMPRFDKLEVNTPSGRDS